jgi:hypothetical protein
MQIIAIIILLLFITGILYSVLTGKGNVDLSENDAKRFARLLITEIKLYQSTKIESGLRNNNLYEVLRDEIERARKMFQKRIMSREFEKYFDEALVEILADGDPSKFGAAASQLIKNH